MASAVSGHFPFSMHVEIEAMKRLENVSLIRKIIKNLCRAHWGGFLLLKIILKIN